jgi:hypothetical protein
MRIVGLINFKNRTKPCCFCGTHKSVKYKIELDDGLKTQCCNKCAVTQSITFVKQN